MTGREVKAQQERSAGGGQVDGQGKEAQRPQAQVVAAENAVIVGEDRTLDQRNERSRAVEHEFEDSPVTHSTFPTSCGPGRY